MPAGIRTVQCCWTIHQSGTQLLVAGGYGHSRLRQWALGGMTRELLFTARIPVLFSH